MKDNCEGGEVKEDSWDGTNVASINQRSKKLIKGQILVSLWYLCSVWNTTALLCVCHRDTEAGLEEEY